MTPPLSSENEARAEYQGVGADIMALIDLRDGIEQRLDVAIRRMGGKDPLRFRALLGEVLQGAATTATSAKQRATPSPRVYDVPVMHAVFEFARAQNGNGFTLREMQSALEPKGYLSASMSPALSRLKSSGVVGHNPSTGRYVLTKRGREEITIRPGFPLTEAALVRLGFLRGKNER